MSPAAAPLRVTHTCRPFTIIQFIRSNMRCKQHNTHEWICCDLSILFNVIYLWSIITREEKKRNKIRASSSCEVYAAASVTLYARSTYVKCVRAFRINFNYRSIDRSIVVQVLVNSWENVRTSSRTAQRAVCFNLNVRDLCCGAAVQVNYFYFTLRCSS